MLIGEQTIKSAIFNLSKEIVQDYRHYDYTIIYISSGSVIFYADLLRNLSLYNNFPNTGSIILRTYDKIQPNQDHIPNLLSMINTKFVINKKVLIMDDILDTGFTIQLVYKTILELKPIDIKLCFLLRKGFNQNLPKEIEANIKYTCFSIPLNIFVVGYGLDYDDKYRGLPFISIYEEDDNDK